MVLLLAVGICLVSALLNGLAVSVTWGWFVVPTFGLPPLSIPAAIGVCLVASLLTHQLKGHRDDQTMHEKMVDLLNSSVVHPLLTMGVGWIVKGFMV